MLWAMLIYYFSSSSGMDLLVKDIEKPVKQYVQNEATDKQIISINKEMRSENVSANKDRKEASGKGQPQPPCHRR